MITVSVIAKIKYSDSRQFSTVFLICIMFSRTLNSTIYRLVHSYHEKLIGIVTELTDYFLSPNPTLHSVLQQCCIGKDSQFVHRTVTITISLASVDKHNRYNKFRHLIEGLLCYTSHLGSPTMIGFTLEKPKAQQLLNPRCWMLSFPDQGLKTWEIPKEPQFFVFRPHWEPGEAGS